MRTPPKITPDTPIRSDVDLEVEDVRLPSGRRVTDDVVADLIETARVGRPSLTAPGRHSPSITLRLPKELLDRLDEEVERTGRRRSEIIREALNDKLAG
ncbi:ribbon-helix-helix protein, CopG family [Enemella sp. A6]|uniref:ribbon-helix-helix protein, CopG family n=1 Tax=Enemella sp. A6 TaxID=3440152 RepID=UPI003EBF3132